MKYKRLEKEILKKMFSELKHKEINKIIFQIENSEVISREFTWVWFYTEIQVKENKKYELNYKWNLIFWDIWLFIDNNIILWFLFYISKWYLVQIEWYSYWDFEINNIESIPKNYKICYLKEKRDLLKELKL